MVNRKRQPLDDKKNTWSGATEIYRLVEEMDSNILAVEIDVMDEHLKFMKRTFPK